MSKTASISGCAARARPPQRMPQPLLFRTYHTLSTSAPAPQPELVRLMQAPASKVVLQVTILPAMLSCLQQAVSKSCGKVIDILAIESVPRSQCIRVRLGIDGSSINAAMEAIIRTMPSGEIGRIAAL